MVDDAACFYDLNSIDPGEEFPARLENGIRDARCVVVLIGRDWLSSLNELASGQAMDFVRWEVELGLKLRAETMFPRVIPVLLGGALPPDSFCDALKPSLSGISAIDIHEFRGKQSDWGNQ